MARCIPCEKEIVNQGAASAVEQMRAMAQAIPGHVAEGRLEPDDASILLNKMIQCERRLIKDAEAIAEQMITTVRHSW